MRIFVLFFNWQIFFIGAQEQRELSEVIVSAQQIPEKSSPEEPDTGKL